MSGKTQYGIKPTLEPDVTKPLSCILPYYYSVETRVSEVRLKTLFKYNYETTMLMIVNIAVDNSDKNQKYQSGSDH